MILATPPIDVCLISGARPALLSRTLDSFYRGLIRKLNVSNFIANIDLFGGGEFERKQCAALVCQYFPEAELFEPATPHFTAAVKRVWERAQQAVVLHLEDDWILLEDVDYELIPQALSGNTRAVKFLSKEHNRDPKKDGKFDIGWTRTKFMGITWRKKPYNRHGTSPGFFDGDFIRTWASKLDLTLDPEKQARPPWNPGLFEYVNQYRCEFITGQNQTELIADIGRPWRDNQGLIKRVIDGRSEWRKSNGVGTER